MSGLKTSTPDGAVVAYLADARARVDAVLQSWGVRAGEWWQAPVPAAMRYSLLSTGKRLRPTLVFAAAEAVGGGVEVVHAYSLVHDDLPCMDNDGLRRGRATTHRAFDVATAVVAGYHMVALGARVLDAGLAALALAPEARRGIALELFRAAGAGGMIGGQALDLAAEAGGCPRPSSKTSIGARRARSSRPRASSAPWPLGRRGERARRCGATARTWGSPSRSTTTCSTRPPPRTSWARPRPCPRSCPAGPRWRSRRARRRS